MPRTYHFMGWNRDSDQSADRPCLSSAPLEPIQFIDEASVFSPAVWDAMTAAMVFGTGVVEMAHRRGSLSARVVRPEEMWETEREREVRLWKRPMFTMKDDDPQITWDHKAMATRPFRARKD